MRNDEYIRRWPRRREGGKSLNKFRWRIETHQGKDDKERRKRRARTWQKPSDRNGGTGGGGLWDGDRPQLNLHTSERTCLYKLCCYFPRHHLHSFILLCTHASSFISTSSQPHVNTPYFCSSYLLSNSSHQFITSVIYPYQFFSHLAHFSV